MENKTGLLLLILLILSYSSCAQQNDRLAPEATTAESEISYWDLPYLEEAFIDAAPADRKDGIPVGELGIDGGDKAMILKLAQEMADTTHGLYDGLLIAHKGKLIFESYYLRGRVNLLHQQASATKSYTGLALGRAIQLGYLTMTDLDKPLVSFLKDLDPSKFVEGVEKITLYQALTMRGGLSITSDQWKALKVNPEALKGQGLVQALLEHSAPITSASQSFVYGNFNPDLVMQVIDAVVPGTAKAFIENELYDKIGISKYRWETNVDGLPAAGGPSYLTSRDMLKLGALIINKGKWNGEQLISAKFLADATKNITKATASWQPDNFNYGYLFYQTDITIGDKIYSANIAWGGGGQHLITVEALDLVVAITGNDEKDTIMNQVSNTIVPAFAKDKFPVLEGPYLGQKPPGLIPELFAPGIVSILGRNESGISFSPELDQMYFTVNKKDEETSIHFSKLIGNKWTPTKRANFTNGEKLEELYPFVSLIDDRIYFTAFDSIISDEKIWYVNRLEDSWSDAMQLDSPINDDLVFYINQAKNGDLFYTSIAKGKMYHAPNQNGEFPEVQEVELEFGHHGFISPSQEYLLVYNRSKENEKREDSDIYVCFKENDGTWAKPINLGSEVNSTFGEGCPSITPDGKYLFFTRSNDEDGLSDMYWVDAQIIENLRLKQ